MKTILLMRHSIPEKSSEFVTDPGLSSVGIKHAKEIFSTPRFADVSQVWASPSQRAFQTANLLERPVRTNPRLLERKTGDTTGQDLSFWKRQYEDPDFKNPDGESFREVNARMSACIREILSGLPDGETALVVSHAAVICAYLQSFCTVEVTHAEQKLRRIRFHGKLLLDGKLGPMTGFVLRVDSDGVSDVEPLPQRSET